MIIGLTNGMTAAMGWSITGCRFLGGGTFSNIDNIGKSHISVLTTSSEATASGTICGNTLKKAGSGAYDNNTTGKIGPINYGINFQGDGKMRIAVTGNEMHDCSKSTTLGAYGKNIKIYASGNSWDLSSLPNYFDGGAELVTG